MEWTNMIDVLSKCGTTTELTVYWADGTTIKGYSEGISETCDCRPSGDSEYEYYMCILKITAIEHCSDKSTFSKQIGDLVEVSEIYMPDKIIAKGEGVVWQRKI